MDLRKFYPEPMDFRRFSMLCGSLNSNLIQLEQGIGLRIRSKGSYVELTGDTERIDVAVRILEQLYEDTGTGNELLPEDIHLLIKKTDVNYKAHSEKTGRSFIGMPVLKSRKGLVKPRSENQEHYIKCICDYDINFGVGPAGTGKTYLAVACAIQALETDRVSRIILTRPAVEAGENLGFLPGDLSQKIDPYLRPLYDALYEMIGFDRVAKLIEKNIIEIAPLAFMRGRTLNNSFVILDESQNTTKEQMKMFLTRIGFGSIAVVTGDITQIDLPSGCTSGLAHARKVLAGVHDIGVTYFNSSDVMRHTLVQRIVEAYGRYDLTTKTSNESIDNNSLESIQNIEIIKKQMKWMQNTNSTKSKKVLE